MIRLADENMLPRLRRMWQTCFDESKEYTEFVFSNLLHSSQMLVHTGEDGRPAAMLNWKLLRFTTPRATVTGAYIFGVATLPEYRRRGLSRTLMSKLHTILQERGVSLACLIPAEVSLFNLYRGQGFETVFFYRRLNVAANDIPKSSGGVLSVAKLEEMEKTRNAFFAGSSLFGAWDKRHLRYTGLECRFYSGEALRFSGRGGTGYAVCYPKKDGGILVKELCAAHNDLPALLAALHTRFGAAAYDLRLPADFPPYPGDSTVETLPLAMVKWYDNNKRPAGEIGGAPWFAFGLD